MAHMQQSQSSSSRTVTMRHTTGGQEEQSSSYVPKMSLKNVIVQRSSGGGRSSRSGMFGSGSSSYGRTSVSLNPAIYSQMAGTGIADYRDHRTREKRDMQDCNERLATYIEKVRFLEANCKRLEAENEALRKRKQEDWRPIRDMFEGELAQAREVIKELSTTKGINEAKLASMQDEIESLKDIISTHETNAKEYVSTIDRLNGQIGEYEGELNTLRLRCGSLEDEIGKLRALINKYKDENLRLRADLDQETAAHIQQEVLAQSLQEEVDFLNDILARLDTTQQEAVHVKSLDYEKFFTGEIRKCVADIQQAYDEKMEQMAIDCESKVQLQLNQLKSGNIRDSMEAEHSKNEVKRVRDQLAERNARIAQLESELAQIRVDRDNKLALYTDLQMEFEKHKVDHERQIAEFQLQVEELMAQLRTLMDAKMSMELEIACYKKLLEGEENRTGLRQLVEQTIGLSSGGASQMAEIIGGMSGGGMGMSSGQMSQMSTMTSTMKMQKSRTGPLEISEFDPSGTKLVLRLDNSAKSPMDMSTVRLVKKVGGVEKRAVDFSSWRQRMLKEGEKITIYTTNAKSRIDNPSTEFLCDFATFETGPGDFLLLQNGKEVASLKVFFG